MSEKRKPYGQPAPLEAIFPGTSPHRVRELMDTPEFSLRIGILRGRRAMVDGQSSSEAADSVERLRKSIDEVDANTKNIVALGWSSSEIGAADLTLLGSVLLPDE